MPFFKSPLPKVSEAKYFVVNAAGVPLGRLAAKIGTILQGKNAPSYVPMWVPNHYVYVLGSDQIRLTGNKWESKRYSHSLHVGGLKARKAKELKPSELIRLAVSGMLPKNRLRDRLLKRLKVVSSIPPNVKNFEEVKVF
jgi:large subunit ribosomal protein L13